MLDRNHNPLREVRVIKRSAALVVVGSVGVLLSLYAVGLDLSLKQLAVLVVTGLLLAFLWVELASRWGQRIRRHYAYPSILGYQLASVHDFRLACDASVHMVGQWLRARAGVVAWLDDDGQELRPVAAYGLPGDWADVAPHISMGLRSLREMAQKGGVLVKPSAEGDPWFGRDSHGGRVVYVALVSQDRPRGVLALLVGPRQARDHRLLSSLATVMALALDNCRLYEGEREGARQMQQMNRMKSDFLITVSHELRTPLTSIKAAAEMLLEEEEQSDPDGPRSRLVRTIVKGASRLSGLVADLVDVSRNDDFAPRLELDAVPVSDMVSSAVMVIQPLLAAKQQTLEVHIPDPELRIYVDRFRFEQVLLNLLSNAHRYTPDMGNITVRCWEANGEVTIAVSDSGPGVPEQERERIFEPFFRGDRSGLGLGLAIAKSVVELHSGRIWVESGPGGIGSSFCVSLTSHGPEPAAVASESRSA